MHVPKTAKSTTTATPDDVDGALTFLWLELTNRCNLQCVHCYTESSPYTGDLDRMSAEDYENAMDQAIALGCAKLQLIGGEPQLNRSFQRLLRYSVDVGFEFVEVFTNLTRLDEETLEFSAGNGVHFATSVYSEDPDVHDAVTQVRGSHRRTIRNLRRLVAADVPVRAAVISIHDDEDALERTRQFLVGLGAHAQSDRSAAPREFGRGEELLGKQASLSGLCGHCWNGSLAIAPDGSVFPCVMSRQWPVGDFAEQTLGDIVRGAALARLRRQIYDDVWQPKITAAPCSPAFCHQTCGPDLSCPCEPLLCQQSCAPWDAHTLPG